jgi:hypothetical protein
MNCWNCGASYPAPDYGKISFRALCEKCEAGLHCCKNCKNYKPGLPNDCAIPGTDYIADRTANNFCEEFSLLGKGPSSPPKNASKKPFDDLFK